VDTNHALLQSAVDLHLLTVEARYTSVLMGIHRPDHSTLYGERAGHGCSSGAGDLWPFPLGSAGRSHGTVSGR
jgi:hypothetical protein